MTKQAKTEHVTSKPGWYLTPIKVIKRPSKPYLPPYIRPNNVYGIFSLFFNDEVLGIIIKNINRYKFRYYQALKTTWYNLSARELKVFLESLIYYSLYLYPKH